jgi:dTMP kinase
MATADPHPGNRARGILISLEGGEGCGKTTLRHALASLLRRYGYHVVSTREPGGTPVGSQLRTIMLERDAPLPAVAELLLIAAARALHVTEVIRPALQTGAIVLVDRYLDSTIIYQGAVRRLRREDLDWANRLATDGLLPDLTLLLDVDPTIGLARRRQNGSSTPYDRADLSIHHTIRRAFLDLAASTPHRIVTIDASRDPQAVLASALTILHDRFGFPDNTLPT